MPLIDLDEVGMVMSLHPLWSASAPAPVWFRRADFLGGGGAPLAEAVHQVVEQQAGGDVRGPVALLANLRTWGWLFNPASFYFCYSPDGAAVEHLVLEVENTPWHERCQYVAGPPGPHRLTKAMHVSPFLPMGADYRLRYSPPGERLTVHMDVLRGQERLFAASLSLRRLPLDRRQLGRFLWSHPAMAHRVSSGIYAQAARLAARGAPFFPHPGRHPERYREDASAGHPTVRAGL